MQRTVAMPRNAAVSSQYDTAYYDAFEGVTL